MEENTNREDNFLELLISVCVGFINPFCALMNTTLLKLPTPEYSKH
jgi:hypothetical protein